MRPATTLHILADYWLGKSLRECYWALSGAADKIGNLFQPHHRAFLNVVMDDYRRFVVGVKPIEGNTWRHAETALGWLIRAQDATPDGGVSYGYFPTASTEGWDVSYPETSGYIMTTFVDYHRRTGEPSVLGRAVRIAEWEVDIQMPSGAVQGGKLCPPEQQKPVSFNTGMVLDGWCSVYSAAPNERIFAAARRAADFLVNDISKEGYLQTNGPFVRPEVVKTYNCLCAWPLYRFGQHSGEERYKQAAITVVEAALRKQKPNGWFADNCLTRHEAPLSHTVGYSLQGILEVGILAGRRDFVEAAQRGVDPVIAKITASGFLPGRFYEDWEPAALSSCLTGAAQIAVVCYRLANHLHDHRYRSVADRLVNFLKALQVLESEDPGLNGALAGSFPIYGGYMTGGYPNWATKYFLDALMLQMDAHA